MTNCIMKVFLFRKCNTMKCSAALLILFPVLFAISFNTRAQLVLPGDYPDPSVTKVGDTYWASATTSNWAPVFPLVASKDLIHWETKAFVFKSAPKWADYYFWAPEIEYENGKVFVYYSAHKKGGNLCLSIASADKPEGPYTDHGPLMCQEVGSIDAFPVRDENGKLHLIWKEDGNSVGKPTPMWISEMKEDRTGLIGEKRELFRNDAEWERNLVEGVSIIRHGGYFYAFYAAAGCCGTGCTYATGIARAKRLLGPWEKYEKNPILDSSEEWKCPGHGTPVEKDGKYYFLFHAYHGESSVYAGRQGLLREFEFTPDGWLRFTDEVTPNVKVKPEIKDEFNDGSVSSLWQWSVLNPPEFRERKGVLELSTAGGNTRAFVGQKTFSTEYKAQTTIVVDKSSSEAGLAAIGDDENMLAASVLANKLRVWKLEKGQLTILDEMVLANSKEVTLQIDVRNGKDMSFSYSVDGKTFIETGSGSVDGSFLPPWDRAVRVGLVSTGQNSGKAVFENFILYH